LIFEGKTKRWLILLRWASLGQVFGYLDGIGVISENFSGMESEGKEKVAAGGNWMGRTSTCGILAKRSTNPTKSEGYNFHQFVPFVAISA